MRGAGVAERERSGNGAESGLNRALKDRSKSEVDPTGHRGVMSVPVIITLTFDLLTN